MRVELDRSVNGLDRVHLGGAQASFGGDVRTEFVRDLPRLQESRRVTDRRRLGKADIVVFGQQCLDVSVGLGGLKKKSAS